MDSPVDHASERRHVLREALTMALYLAISLLAVLTSLPAHAPTSGGAVALLWGTNVGLLLAHVLAFRITAWLASGGTLATADRRAMVGQGIAAVAVGIVATLPFMMARVEAALDVSRLTLAGGVGVLVYAVGRQTVGSGRAGRFALVVVVLALGVAVAKNALAGH